MTNVNGRRRNLPYLHRNWLTAINGWQVADKKHTSRPGKGGADELADRDDHYARPAKRRRFSDLPTPDAVSTQDVAGYLLPEEPRALERALRVEILKIIHKDSSRVRSNGIFNGIAAPAVKDVSSTQARCRMTITCERYGEPTVIYCDSQLCEIKTTKNPVGPSRMARVYLPQPFQVPQDKILVEREDDAVYDLADSYNLIIELESAGGQNWPPLGLSSSDDPDLFRSRPASPRLWTLSATVNEIFGRGRTSTRLQLRRKAQHPTQTDFIMDVDTRWTAAFADRSASKRLEKDMQPSITVLDLNEDIPQMTNGVVNGNAPLLNGDVSNDNLAHEIMDDMDEDAEGELTPSRSLRHRESKVYNLKVLSDKAQGREKRRRRKMERYDRLGEDSRVTYHLPAEQFMLDGFPCCICQAYHQSMSQLRAHCMIHPEYFFDFDFRHGKGGGHQVRITHNADAPGSPIRPKIYQLGRPTKLLDLEKYVEGDDSWITSRYGPDNDKVQDRHVYKAPQVSCISGLDWHCLLRCVRRLSKKNCQKPSQRRRDKRILVPNTKQPLFDPLSKVRLEPGTEVRPPVADDSWLVQKHRDNLQDFVDVDPAEKEYMTAWDAFISKRRISSDAYFPRAFASFVREKGPWLVARQSRLTEFGKHLSVLVVRGSLTDETIQQVMALINDFKARRRQGDEHEPSPSQSSPKDEQYKSVRGCTVCGLPVMGPSLVICSNRVSTVPQPCRCSRWLLTCHFFSSNARAASSMTTASGLMRRCPWKADIGAVMNVVPGRKQRQLSRREDFVSSTYSVTSSYQQVNVEITSR